MSESELPKGWGSTFNGPNGKMQVLKYGVEFSNAFPPFAYVIESDGQKVRLEAPTLEGLKELIAFTESEKR